MLIHFLTELSNGLIPFVECMNELVHNRAQTMVVIGFLTAWSLFTLPINLMLILSLSTLTFE